MGTESEQSNQRSDSGASDLDERVSRVAMAALAGAILFAIRHGIAARYVSTAIDTSLAAFFIAVLFVRYPADPKQRAHVLLAAAWIGLFGMSWVSGQGEAAVLWWFAAVPLAAAYVSDRIGMWVWTGLSLLAIVAMNVGSALAPYEPEFVSVGSERTVSQMVLVCLLFAVAAAVRQLADRTLSETDGAREDALKLANLLQQSVSQLDTARREAEKEASARKDFAAAVSHEIRTPLAAMLGMAELMRDETDLALAREQSEDLLRSGNTLLRIVDNILVHSRTQSGELVVATEAFELDTAIEDALQLYESQARARGIDLAHIPGFRVPNDCVGDGAAVQQIVANLVGNALRYTESGEVRVSTRLIDVGRIAIDVDDTGVGIGAEQLDRIWDPWTRGSSEKVGGTGLGLALVKGVTEALGGTVSVHSTVGRGSTFSITFPLDFSTTQLPMSDTLPRSALVAVDRPASADALLARLRNWAVKPLWVQDAGSMKEALIGGTYDVLICPEAWLRVLGDMARPPVLIFEAGPATHRATEALTIPVRSDVLRTALSRAIGRADPLGPRQPTFDGDLADRNPMDILLVEDNETNQRLMIRMLRRFGYEAALAGNGRAAVEAAAGRHFDLILMDRAMPELDGIEAARQILAARPDTRIVMVSAGYDGSQRDECLSMGLEALLDKPVPIPMLKALLSRPAAGRPTPSPAQAPEVTDPPGLVEALANLRDICRNDDAEVAHLVWTWIDGTTEQLTAARAALADDDLNEVNRNAHLIKGSSGFYGAIDVVEQARITEDLADSDPDRDALAAALDELNALVEVAFEWLKKEVPP